MKASDLVFELGLNHLGDVARGLRMIDQLRAQEATHLTLQIVIDPLRMTRDTKSADFLRPHCLTLSENIELLEYARGLGLVAGATVLDPADLPELVDAGIEFFKILSSDISYHVLHQRVAKTQLPFYISTGACTLDEVRRAVDSTRAEYPFADLRLIHTVIEVPTPVEHLNLANIGLLIEQFQVPVAYGQHSDVRDAVPTAIAAGAETVFVYVAEERTATLPDGPHSIVCHEANDLLKRARAARTMLGCRERRLQPAEEKARASIRRSIVAGRPISAGARVTLDDVAFKRPGTGREPWDAEMVLGHCADRDYETGEDIIAE